MHPFLNIAIQAARSAGRIILRQVDRLDQITVHEKKYHDFVTDTDKMAEADIINQIRKAYPDHAILSEEAGQHGQDDSICWVVDPLDGTLNFLHGFPQFAISIAVKKKQQLEVACIYDPIRQELFTAVRGKGAQLNNRRMRVSNTQKLELALVGTGFPCREPHLITPYLNTFANILPKVVDIRRAGSAALDLAYVAAGRLDGFWETGLAEWDIAAGALMIQEAGGLATDFDGSNNVLKSGNIVAGNLAIHKELISLIA